MDLDLFAPAVSKRVSEWSAFGIAATFHQVVPEHTTRLNWAAWVTLDSAAAAGDLIVWVSGEAELGVRYLPDGPMLPEHWDLTDATSLDACLDHLTRLMTQPPPADD